MNEILKRTNVTMKYRNYSHTQKYKKNNNKQRNDWETIDDDDDNEHDTEYKTTKLLNKI